MRCGLGGKIERSVIHTCCIVFAQAQLLGESSFCKNGESSTTIVAVHVDDLNMIAKTTKEMKYLEKQTIMQQAIL